MGRGGNWGDCDNMRLRTGVDLASCGCVYFDPNRLHITGKFPLGSGSFNFPIQQMYRTPLYLRSQVLVLLRGLRVRYELVFKLRLLHRGLRAGVENRRENRDVSELKIAQRSTVGVANFTTYN